MIEKHLSTLSCNNKEFNKAKEINQTALKESGYDTSLTFQPGN